MQFSNNGQYVASGSKDRTVRLWDLSNRRQLACFRGHEGEITELTFSFDDTQVLSASEDGTVRVWNAHYRESQAPKGRERGHITSLAFSASGDFVVTGANDSCVSIWNASDGRERHILARHDRVVDLVVCHPTEDVCATSSSWGGPVIVWDISAGQCLGELDHALLGHATKVAFSVVLHFRQESHGL